MRHLWVIAACACLWPTTGCTIRGRGKLPSGIGWKDKTDTHAWGYRPARLDFEELGVEITGIAVKEVTTYTALGSVDERWREFRISASTHNLTPRDGEVGPTDWVNGMQLVLDDGGTIEWPRRYSTPREHGIRAGQSRPGEAHRKIPWERQPRALIIKGRRVELTPR